MLRTLLLTATLAVSACTPDAGSSSVQTAGATAEPDSLDWALAALTRSDAFEEAHLGIGGESLSEKATAFRIVLRASDPTEQFRTMLHEGTVAGQLYALAGLRLTAPAEFERTAARFTPRQDSVQYASGCETWDERVENLVRAKSGGLDWDIASGTLPRSLAGRRVASRE